MAQATPEQFGMTEVDFDIAMMDLLEHDFIEVYWNSKDNSFHIALNDKGIAYREEMRDNNDD